MKNATYNTNKRIEKRILALVLIISPSLLFGNAAIPINDEITAAGSSIIRKGWLAAPEYTQEWLFQGARGDRLVITASPISGGIVPEIYMIFGEDDTVVASTTSSENDYPVLQHEIEATGTYTIAIRDKGLDNEGGYKIFLEKIAAPESARQTSAPGTSATTEDEDVSGLSCGEISILVTIGTVVTILTGPFAPLAMMVVARVLALFPV